MLFCEEEERFGGFIGYEGQVDVFSGEGPLVGVAEEEQCFGEIDRSGVDGLEAVEKFAGAAAALPAPAGWRADAAVPFSWGAAVERRDLRRARDLGARGAGRTPGRRSRRGRHPGPNRPSGGGGLPRAAAGEGRSGDDGHTRLDGARPAAPVVLSERVRPDAAATLAYLAGQGIAVKVISGDHPETAAAIARSLGLSDGGRLDVSDVDDARLEAAAGATAVFGRVRPEQKRTIIGALQRRGHTVAMVGDGVNDVLALKAADVAVAMGAGSGAARAVAHLVLLDGSFAHVPLCVAEGRRVIGNIERLADLFITKMAYAMLLILAVSPAGLPSVFLAQAPNRSRVAGGFVRRVLRYSVPAGVVAGLAMFLAYILALREPEVSDMQARTVATLVLAGVGLLVLADLARPLTWARRALVALMGAGVALAVAIPATREFLALEVPPPIVLATGAGVVPLAALALRLVRPRTGAGPTASA